MAHALLIGAPTVPTHPYDLNQLISEDSTVTIEQPILSVEEVTINHFLLSSSASATTLLPGQDKPAPSGKRAIRSDSGSVMQGLSACVATPCTVFTTSFMVESGPSQTGGGRQGTTGKLQDTEKADPANSYPERLPRVSIQTIIGSCFCSNGNEPQRVTGSQLLPLGATEAM